MKLKNILIVSLILAILTIGAVSASEEITSDDNLEVEDDVISDDLAVEDVIAEDNLAIDDTGSEEDMAVEEVSDDSSQDKLAEVNDERISFNEDDYYCNIEEEYQLYDDYDNQYDILSFRSYNDELTGAFRVYVDGSIVYSQQITVDDYDYDDDEYYYSLYLNAGDLDIYSFGTYDIKVTLAGQTLAQQTVDVTYPFYLDSENGENYGYGEKIKFTITLPNDATGKATFTFNGKKYDIAYKNGVGSITLNSLDFGLGTFNAAVTYEGDSKYSRKTESMEINIIPNIYVPYRISVGEKERISIEAPSHLSGSAIITCCVYDEYEDDYVFVSKKSISITNGFGSYSLVDLAEKEYRFEINYQMGIYSDSDYYHVFVVKNSPGFSTTISPTQIVVGNKVTVTVKGPKLSEKVGIYVDDQIFKEVTLVTGEISEIISGLSVGTHKVNVYFYGYADMDSEDDLFYSYTDYVTVKQATSSALSTAKTTTTKKVTKKATKIVAAKKTFKKSKKIKKYTITLKSGKTLIKKVKVTLAIKGKKYVAKTNSKGKATFKIKNLKKKGKFTAVIKFAGNSKYLKSSKKVKITVKK